MQRIIIIFALISVSHIAQSDCWPSKDTYYVTKPFHIAGLERINQSPIYKSRNDYLTSIFGVYEWGTASKNLVIQAPDWPENRASVTINIDIMQPVKNKGDVYLFAEYKHNSEFQYERLSKVSFYKNIMSSASRYNLPVTAKVFAVLRDGENNIFMISKDKKINIHGICSGIPVATQIEADKLNKEICNGIPEAARSKHPACYVR